MPIVATQRVQTQARDKHSINEAAQNAKQRTQG